MFCIEIIVKIWEIILILEYEYYEWLYIKYILWLYVMKLFYFFFMEDLDCVDYLVFDYDF